jgi:hypothetical protein
VVTPDERAFLSGYSCRAADSDGDAKAPAFRAFAPTPALQFSPTSVAVSPSGQYVAVAGASGSWRVGRTAVFPC